LLEGVRILGKKKLSLRIIKIKEDLNDGKTVINIPLETGIGPTQYEKRIRLLPSTPSSAS
jgi:hypothetical protein